MASGGLWFRCCHATVFYLFHEEMMAWYGGFVWVFGRLKCRWEEASGGLFGFIV